MTAILEPDIDWDDDPDLDPTRIGKTDGKSRMPRGANFTLDEHEHAAFLENVDFLHTTGMNHQDIAKRLNIGWSAYEQRLLRAGRSVLEVDRRDREAMQVFERLIAEGRPFHADYLPETSSQNFSSQLFANARKAGRIRIIGKATALRGTLNMYRSVAAIEAEATSQETAA